MVTDRRKLKKRFAYSLRFKADVCAAVEDLLSLKCAACGTVARQWRGRQHEGAIEDHCDWNMWDEKEEHDGKHDDEDDEDDEDAGEEVSKQEAEEDEPLRCKGCGCEHFTRALRFQCEVANKFGIHKSLVSKWLKMRSLWFQLCKNRKKIMKMVSDSIPPSFSLSRYLSHLWTRHTTLQHRGGKVAYPIEEDILFGLFIYRRKVKGLSVDCYWHVALAHTTHEHVRRTPPLSLFHIRICICIHIAFIHILNS
jgi:hypothetical protein